MKIGEVRRPIYPVHHEFNEVRDGWGKIAENLGNSYIASDKTTDERAKLLHRIYEICVSLSRKEINRQLNKLP